MGNLMSWVDLIIIGVIAISALISLVRGFVKESISLASWVLAGFIALRYFTPLAELLEPYIESPTIRTGSSFATLFVCSLIIGAIINFMASQLVTKTGLSGTDKSLGVVFGAARGFLIVIILVLLAGLTPMPSESWWQESAMIEYFASMAGWIKEVLPDDIAGKFSL
jgi:membrane protein required for colicin V production